PVNSRDRRRGMYPERAAIPANATTALAGGEGRGKHKEVSSGHHVRRADKARGNTGSSKQTTVDAGCPVDRRSHITSVRPGLWLSLSQMRRIWREGSPGRRRETGAGVGTRTALT